MIDPQGSAWCDGLVHGDGDRPRALLMVTVAGPTTETLHVCGSCAPRAAEVFARAVVEAAEGKSAIRAMGGMLTFSLLPQPPTGSPRSS